MAMPAGARAAGGCPQGGGGPGGAVDSVNGKTGVVVLTAADVSADPAGTATAAVAAHVGLGDPHTQYLLKAGGTMSGNIDMDGSNLLAAGAVASTGNVSGATMSAGTFTGDLAGDVNGVTIESAGDATDSLRRDGSYQTVQAYGSTFEPPVVNLLPVAISGTAFLPIIASTATSVLPAGTYELQWYSALTATNAGGRAAARVQADFGGGLAPFSDIVGYQAGNNTAEVIVCAEPLAFTLGAAQAVSFLLEARDSGAGTWANVRTQFQIVRTS